MDAAFGGGEGGYIRTWIAWEGGSSRVAWTGMGISIYTVLQLHCMCSGTYEAPDGVTFQQRDIALASQCVLCGRGD